ncbi:hypothetical protein HDU87_008681 [Geranomyces variabilis]|uniref:Non-homologous end-joining factor 1 n=1 Tax=Geranomyces variabilis TaxID=109894 RepID=A0AAD5TDV1_9FUNG|nr:hypothetical protein HDU87_008681 [Geranomyces variabilis]
MASQPAGPATPTDLLAALQPLPWVPFTLPTAHTAEPLSVLLKYLFTPTAYTVLLTDLERVWVEHATAETIERKLKTYARSFSETPLDKMLPVLEGFMKTQDAKVKYMGVFEPDETGDLKLHATGPAGPLTLRWVFELTQLTTAPTTTSGGSSTTATPPTIPHSGAVIHAQILAPLLAVAAEQARRIEALYAALDKADRDVRACWDVVGRLPKRRPEPFSRAAFEKNADAAFKKMLCAAGANPSSTPGATASFLTAQTTPLYALAVEKLSQQPREADSGDADVGSEAGHTHTTTDRTLPDASPAASLFADSTLSPPTHPPRANTPPSPPGAAAASTAPSESQPDPEAEAAAAAERARERQAGIARHRAAQQVKQKKRKLL